VKAGNNFTLEGNATKTTTTGTNSSIGQGVTATGPANTLQGNLMFKVTVQATTAVTTTEVSFAEPGAVGHPVLKPTTTESTSKTYYSAPNNSSKVLVIKAGQ
jgi:hypothetical protein